MLAVEFQSEDLTIQIALLVPCEYQICEVGPQIDSSLAKPDFFYVDQFFIIFYSFWISNILNEITFD